MHFFEDTKKFSQPRETQRKIVTEVRKVTYINHNPDPKNDEPLVTEGFEVVKELSVSPDYIAGMPKVVGLTKTIDNRDKPRMFKNNIRDMIRERQDDRS